ncbi:histidine kinase [Flavobacterium sp.]|uniref:sensor histidine kinase n=1 Tax=Flavobacterium sp. TaxID=239 RepID=UPI0026034EBE|nr:histidine kinase [Flavobacterium sp.]
MLFYAFTLSAQEPFLRKISFLEGMPSDVIYDMYVSEKGLLYLGTDKGLVSYDGVHFILYPFDENLSNSVNSIQEDENGVIYCKNFSNQIYFLSNERLNLDKTFNDLISKRELSVVEFSVLNKQKVLLTPNEFYTFNKNKPALLFESKRQIDKNDFFHLAYNAVNKEFYVSSLQSILVFKNNQFIEEKKTYLNQKILEVYRGNVCYVTKNNENKIDVSGKNINTDILKTTSLNKLSSCGSELWICTNDGILEVNVAKNSLENSFLSGKRVSDIVIDKEGNHWISTLDNGLFFMPSLQLKSLSIKDIDEQKKPNFSRVKIAKNKHFFVATSTGSVFEFDQNGKQLLKYQSDNKTEIEFITLHNDLIITSACIFKVGNPKPITDKKMYFGKEVTTDNYGNFLIASSSYAGLLAHDFKSNLVIPENFSKYKLQKVASSISFLCFRERRARTVFFDAKTNIYYVAYNDGLFFYDKTGVERQIQLPNNEAIIASEMLQQNDGSIWIATTQNGIIQIKNQKVVKHLTLKNKLSSNNSRRIEMDDESLWILNDKGIENYHFKSGKVKNASANLCMKGITINDFIVRDKIIAFITNEGVFYCSKDIVNELHKPNFEFTNLWINDKKVALKNDLVLDYNHNNIQIDFRTIHYKSLGDYTYEYRFKNQDDKWYSLTSDASNVKFVSLKSGNYIFQIRVKYGDLKSEIKELYFEIKKPFWLQWWFVALEILAIVFLVYWVNKRAVLRTKKRQEVKEQLALSQLTALRSQMNPHFMFNVLNSVQGLIYSNQKSKASEYLGKFSDLMRKILEASDKKEITVEKEFELLDMYISLEKSRFDTDFEYKINLPTSLDLSQYVIPSMIIQPFVENAIKHGLMHKIGLKELKINGEIINEYWQFVIDDNGVGRAKAEQINKSFKSHKSFATNAIGSRISLINKVSSSKIEIMIEDKMSNTKESLGTKITILIPVKIL